MNNKIIKKSFVGIVTFVIMLIMLLLVPKVVTKAATGQLNISSVTVNNGVSYITFSGTVIDADLSNNVMRFYDHDALNDNDLKLIIDNGLFITYNSPQIKMTFKTSTGDLTFYNLQIEEPAADFEINIGLGRVSHGEHLDPTLSSFPFPQTWNPDNGFTLILEEADAEPIINGETNYLSNVDSPVTKATIKSGLSAQDDIDGYIPSSAFVEVSDGYTGNETTLGTYVIRYSVTDSGGNTAYVNVNVHVVDVTAPVLYSDLLGETIAPTVNTTTFEDDFFWVGLTMRQALDFIKSDMSAFTGCSDDQTLAFAFIVNQYDSSGVVDNVDGLYDHIKDVGVVITQYPYSNLNEVFTLKNYQIKFKIQDSSGNLSSEYTFNLNYVDNIPPVITGNNSYTRVYNNPVTLATLKNGLSATDNKDGNLTSSITLKTDNYSSNSATKGSYQVVYTVSDQAGNSTDYPITIQVIDNIKPTLSGQSSYTTSYNTKLSETTIRGNLTATDDYDGTLAVTLVQDNYSSNYNQVGNHTIKYKATDSSGNFVEYTVTITVEDDVPPIIYTNKYFINVDGALNYTLEQIIQHMVDTGQIPDVTVYYSITQTNYMSAPGSYEVVFTKDEDAPADLEETIILAINVLESGEIPDPTTEDPTDEEPPADDEPVVVDTNSFSYRFSQYFKENGAKILAVCLVVIGLLVVASFLGYGGRRRR